jgi:hypothetical protein
MLEMIRQLARLAPDDEYKSINQSGSNQSINQFRNQSILFNAGDDPPTRTPGA